jgi:hypothetical protein
MAREYLPCLQCKGRIVPFKQKNERICLLFNLEIDKTQFHNFRQKILIHLHSQDIIFDFALLFHLYEMLVPIDIDKILCLFWYSSFLLVFVQVGLNICVYSISFVLNTIQYAL